jgi:hypothetical protein
VCRLPHQAFGGLDGLFRAIFYSLLRPKRAIVDEAHAFVASLLRAPPPVATPRAATETAADAPPFVVGLHVRNGRDFRTKKLLSHEWERLARCAHALVPPRNVGGAAGAADGDGGTGAGGGIGSADSTEGDRTAVLLGEVHFAVATESGESRTAAAAALGPAAAFYADALPKGSDGGTTSREGAKRALLELLVVSLSNGTLPLDLT